MCVCVCVRACVCVCVIKVFTTFYIGLVIGIASGATGIVVLQVILITCAYRIWWKPKKKPKKQPNHFDDVMIK